MIYIVEDDASISELEQYALKAQGLDAVGFESGERFWNACATALPNLVILDVMLPGEDGFAILQKLRRNAATRELPVIMVTAKDSEIDVVKGLDRGADDYISKPFGIMEFVSRVKAVLRRGEKNTASLLRFGSLELDDASHLVRADGTEVELTFKEYSLLKLFLESPEEVLSRDLIMKQVWDTEFCVESRTLDMHIRTLRQKLGAAGSGIVTVRKVGYKLTARPEREAAK